jgi:hypothetical protein
MRHACFLKISMDFFLISFDNLSNYAMILIIHKLTTQKENTDF